MLNIINCEGNANQKPLWNVFISTKMMTNNNNNNKNNWKIRVGKDVEKLEHIAGGNANWYSHCGKTV